MTQKGMCLYCEAKAIDYKRLPKHRYWIIETWLCDTKFSTGNIQSGLSNNPDKYFAFTARSYRRRAADNILAR